MKTMWVYLAMASVLAGAAAAQDKKDAAPAGPFGLPLLATVKEKCKTNEAQNGKLEVIYKDAATKEEETKKTGRDNQTDRKDLEKFLLMGKNDTINKIRDVLDPDQQKTFTSLVSASDPKKKK
jgi:hypothetical protein